MSSHDPDKAAVVTLAVTLDDAAASDFLDGFAGTPKVTLRLDGQQIGRVDVLSIDRAPDVVFRSRWLRCARCDEWLAGKEPRSHDGWPLCDGCWDDRLDSAPEGDHPDLRDCPACSGLPSRQPQCCPACHGDTAGAHAGCDLSEDPFPAAPGG